MNSHNITNQTPGHVAYVWLEKMGEIIMGRKLPPSVLWLGLTDSAGGVTQFKLHVSRLYQYMELGIQACQTNIVIKIQLTIFDQSFQERPLPAPSLAPGYLQIDIVPTFPE